MYFFFFKLKQNRKVGWNTEKPFWRQHLALIPYYHAFYWISKCYPLLSTWSLWSYERAGDWTNDSAVQRVRIFPKVRVTLNYFFLSTGYSFLYISCKEICPVLTDAFRTSAKILFMDSHTYMQNLTSVWLYPYPSGCCYRAVLLLKVFFGPWLRC